MNKYILGVDGGGSKTHCAIFDIQGNKKYTLAWGPTNHEVLKGGYLRLKVEIEEMLTKILSDNMLTVQDLEYCVFGLAGVDTKKQHLKISDILRALGLKDFFLCNDAYLGVKAGCTKGFGVCAINGTGCTIAGIDPLGNKLQIGGQGSLTGDFGGGGFLGKIAISSVYSYLYKSGKATIMKDLLYELLDIADREDFLDSIVEKTEKGTLVIKDLNKIIFKAANLQDTVAIEILDKVARENATSINSLISSIDFTSCNSIEIILAGSLYTKGENSTTIKNLEKYLTAANSNKGIVVKKLQVPPVTGAILWALELAGAEMQGMYNKVLHQI